jgi:flavin-dependent dehydrogenase
MLEAEVIIVGAGPAGSACAWKLNQNGIQKIWRLKVGNTRTAS